MILLPSNAQDYSHSQRMNSIEAKQVDYHVYMNNELIQFDITCSRRDFLETSRCNFVLRNIFQIDDDLRIFLLRSREKQQIAAILAGNSQFISSTIKTLELERKCD